MEQKIIIVWTWCPQCTVRTDHKCIKRYYQCMTCGCIHIGAYIIRFSQVPHKR